MAFIVIFNIILYVILLVWTYKNMYSLGNKTKVIYFACMLTFVYIVTIILYNIGGNPIGKQLGEVASSFNKVMQSLFMGINGLITMPHLALALSKYNEQIIDEKGLKKRVIIILAIFVVFLIFEFNYIKDMQLNMIEMIHNK